jgi:hypothetical protein
MDTEGLTDSSSYTSGEITFLAAWYVVQRRNR